MNDHAATREGCKRRRVGSGFAERRGGAVEGFGRDRALGRVKDASRAQLKSEGGDRNITTTAALACPQTKSEDINPSAAQAFCINMPPNSNSSTA